MFKLFRLSLWLLATVVSAADIPVTEVKVDWQKTHQTIVGFGGTLGWIHPHPKQREEVFDLLFNDLGASVLRVQALGGEGGDQVTPEEKNDNDEPAVFDWTKFSFKQTEACAAATIKAAQKRGVKTIIPVTWSPPGWMKSNGNRVGGELPQGMVAEYAELWTAFVLAMKKEFDLDIQYLSIQNEPELTWTYPTCRIEPEVYANVVAALRQRLENEKLKVQVLGPDTCRIYNFSRYVKALETVGLDKGPILTHLYDLSIPFGEVKRDVYRWKEAREFAAERKRSLWLMETANYLSGSSVEGGSFHEALIWAQKIHWALVEGDCEVVCYWALFFDKISESLVYCAKSEAQSYLTTPKFYTSKHYYRFVRPGMRRCSVSDSPEVLCSAFKDEGESKARVLVLVNPSESARALSGDEFAENVWERFETTAQRNCQALKPVRAVKMIVLPARSVTTLRSVAK